MSEASPALSPAAGYPFEISVAELKHFMDTAPERTLVVDVREPYEMEICALSGARHIPMRQIPEQLSSLPRDKHLLLLCHHGARSRHVTEFLRDRGFPATSNVDGGIDAWAAEIEPTMRRY